MYNISHSWINLINYYFSYWHTSVTCYEDNRDRRDTYSHNRTVLLSVCKRDKSSLHFLITERRRKRQIGAVARNGLIRTSKSRPYTIPDALSSCTLQRKWRTEGKKRTKSDATRRGRVTHVTSDPSKMWDRTLAGPSLFFFSTANSPHASRGSWAPVYNQSSGNDGLRGEGERQKRVYCGEDIYAYNAIYSSVSVCRSIHPPLQLSIKKNPHLFFFASLRPSRSFSLPSPPLSPLSLPFLSSLWCIWGIYQRGSRHHDPEIHLEMPPKSSDREVSYHQGLFRS